MNKDPGDGPETLAVDWVAARLAEMDAALSVVESRSAALGTALRAPAEDLLERLRGARMQWEAVARDMVGRRADGAPEMRRHLEQCWTSFEQTLKRWAEIAAAQDDVLGAQLKAQTAIWDDAFEHYKNVATETQEKARAALLRQIEDSARQVTQLQMMAASLGTASWESMIEAMDRTRDTAERAARDIRSALERMKP